MRRSALLPFACCLLPFLNGCAKSPVGATNLAINRFQTTLSLAGTLNPNYYYAIGFDDAGGDGAGPVAVDGTTPIRNGVMGGTFRVLVLYHQNTFRVFYRSTPNSAATESDVTGVTNLFNTGLAPHVTQNGSGVANGLDVTINLDAQFTGGTNNGSYLFPRVSGSQASPPPLASTSLDINVAATNTSLLGDSDTGLRKPVDALGFQTLSTPVEIQIPAQVSTRTTSVLDETGDENLGVSDTFSNPANPSYVPFANIDITNLQIGIVRSQTGQ